LDIQIRLTNFFALTEIFFALTSFVFNTDRTINKIVYTVARNASLSRYTGSNIVDNCALLFKQGINTICKHRDSDEHTRYIEMLSELINVREGNLINCLNGDETNDVINCICSV
jgi:hypothetical protein